MMTQDRSNHRATRRDILAAAGVGAVTLGTGLSRAAALPPAARPSRCRRPTSSDAIINAWSISARGCPAIPTTSASSITWREFEKIGLTLGPCDSYAYRRWDPMAYGLRIAGTDARVAYHARSQPTPPGGVTGPLLYHGKITAKDPVELGDVPKGSIVVFDARLPQTTITGRADPLYVQVPEAKKAAYLVRPYKRVWQMRAFRLEAVLAKGAPGVVDSGDRSGLFVHAANLWSREASRKA